jgi:hypothetical protein
LVKITSPRGDTEFDYDATPASSPRSETDGRKLGFEYEGLLLKRTTWTGEVIGGHFRKWT